MGLFFPVNENKRIRFGRLAVLFYFLVEIFRKVTDVFRCRKLHPFFLSHNLPAVVPAELLESTVGMGNG